MNAQPHYQPPILWSVVQEHLDEAAFFWRQRERDLRAPDHGLADLAEGDERRLLAHVEGLRVAGPRVAERLLAPALAEDGGPVRAVAAYTLLTSDVARWGEFVLCVLREASLEERTWVGQALALSSSAQVVPLLRDTLLEAEPGLGASVLDILRVRQADLTSLLERTPLANPPELLAASIRASRYASAQVLTTRVHQGLASPDARCRDAAIEVGLARGHLAAMEACRRSIAGGACGRTVLTALAMSGDRRAVARLLAELEKPGRRAEALWALGVSGRSEALEALLQRVISEADPLAAESFRLITGIPLAVSLEPAEEEAAEVPAVSDGEPSFLPGPVVPPGRVRVEAIQRWWHEARSRFPAGGRYLWGRCWTPEAALQALLEVPVTRRPALAWELAVRSSGACRVETGLWAWLQVRQLQAARALRMEPGGRTFEAMLASA
ncbi:hypothetical protein HPC49_01940 [Pyxidicoccus fallax]|uniref:TIGR02270 family protein n=1 Tax=Pyxidicoccus fallax TaxID=394095 RepID=A0A848L4A2_9BACT|nr:hypothetical protein [Pyxidicoccus fallax]NMO13800.1 hypothetical protein [Pyxidicoccus fallax]NPC77013.1 hypothetical protein [Pyxidicoccus fallax]